VKIITTVLCCVVGTTVVVHNDTHTHTHTHIHTCACEQLLQVHYCFFSLSFAFCVFSVSIGMLCISCMLYCIETGWKEHLS